MILFGLIVLVVFGLQLLHVTSIPDPDKFVRTTIIFSRIVVVVALVMVVVGGIASLTS